MERYSRILRHSLFLEYIDNIERLERERIYCGHSIEHLTAVARIAYIEVLEKGLTYDKDIIYAMGLLHDIGRTLQYTCGVPHEAGGVTLADRILRDCGYTEQEIKTVADAIAGHRVKQTAENGAAGILYRADKLSRECYLCKAADTCNWPEEQRNHGII